ncbi:hypothetical protein PHYSODRAFT_534739 [Phytophthora sojae]|uniref:Uncharacterized protein n=1 Tax=Phytophthora sojae (strain P6497) TaxID=1094619 RepID=G5AHE4_PHYSP|nr:hypothetical protein PHYSODRAFT_534739 [Phytophthora sojae]EGZ05122.1 hypothetical protein PHYSODRAFT_534739 [Phytophthora sojae]|eukprot:XP_009539494.1 hypothetical protein PHYSODRAFT_534739 [Phytophthora sojae]
MLLYPAIALALALGQVSAATNLTWTPCPLTSDKSIDGSSRDNKAECTMYAAPLCHPRICETPDSAISTVDVFVRRIPAANRQPDVAPNVWLVQGGPNYWDSLRKYCKTVGARDDFKD